MKNTVYGVIAILIALGAAAFVYQKYEQLRPCAEPIAYAIGSIDQRFDTSTTTVIDAAEADAKIWNTAAGKTLLTYDPNAAFKISLIYDSRQSSAQMGEQITQEQADVESERASIEAERSQITPATSASFNAQVALYNQQVQSLNAEIASYNQTAGHSFEEGEFIRDASGERILIYEFVNNTQLERVLAHEFGHAIGLGHNTNPASIMYAENESGNLTPTTDDLAALKAVCGSEISIK